MVGINQSLMSQKMKDVDDKFENMVRVHQKVTRHSMVALSELNLNWFASRELISQGQLVNGFRNQGLEEMAGE